MAFPMLGYLLRYAPVGPRSWGPTSSSSDHAEYGPATLNVDVPYSFLSVLKTLPQRLRVWMSHGDSVRRRPPDGIEAIAFDSSAAKCRGHGRRCAGGIMCTALQFHPEVVHSEHGRFGVAATSCATCSRD